MQLWSKLVILIVIINTYYYNIIIRIILRAHFNVGIKTNFKNAADYNDIFEMYFRRSAVSLPTPLILITTLRVYRYYRTPLFSCEQ
jgi:hypothetical protein